MILDSRKVLVAMKDRACPKCFPYETTKLNYRCAVHSVPAMDNPRESATRLLDDIAELERDNTPWADVLDRTEAALVAERERAAALVEALRPTGGRMWTDEQSAAFEALTECANAIRSTTKSPEILHSQKRRVSGQAYDPMNYWIKESITCAVAILMFIAWAIFIILGLAR